MEMTVKMCTVTSWWSEFKLHESFLIHNSNFHGGIEKFCMVEFAFGITTSQVGL